MQVVPRKECRTLYFNDCEKHPYQKCRTEYRNKYGYENTGLRLVSRQIKWHNYWPLIAQDRSHCFYSNFQFVVRCGFEKKCTTSYKKHCTKPKVSFALPRQYPDTCVHWAATNLMLMSNPAKNCLDLTLFDTNQFVCICCAICGNSANCTFLSPVPAALHRHDHLFDAACFNIFSWLFSPIFLLTDNSCHIFSRPMEHRAMEPRSPAVPGFLSRTARITNHATRCIRMILMTRMIMMTILMLRCPRRSAPSPSKSSARRCQRRSAEQSR